MVAAILIFSDVFLKLDKAELFISGGDFSQIMGANDEQLNFSHGIKIAENNEKVTATYTLKISGGNNLTIKAYGELEESAVNDGAKIYMGTLKGEVRESGKTYDAYVNVDKEINGEKLFASITLQDKNGTTNAFFSVGEPIIFVK